MSREKSKYSERSYLIELGARIRIARGDRSQQWLAEIVGVQKSQISDYELGKNSPQAIRLARIAQATGCDSAWLLLGDDPPGPLADENARYSTPPPGVTPEAWSAIQELLPQLSDIHEAQEIPQHAERWGWIRGNMLTFGDLVRADVEAHRIQKRKIRRAG